MSDENNENIKKENNKLCWKKLLSLKPTYKINIQNLKKFLLFLLFIILIFNLSRIQEYIFTIINANKSISINKIANMKVPRSYHNASFLSENEILITGGYDNKKGRGINTTEILTLSSNDTKMGPNMNLDHYGHTQITTKKGDVYIIDTNGIELLPKENQSKFQKIYGNLPNFYRKDNKLYTFSAVLLENDDILIIGNIDNKYNYNNFSLLIKTQSREVVKLPNFLINRAFFSILALPNSNAFIIGGIDLKEKNTKSKYINEIEYFNYDRMNFQKNIKIELSAFLPFLFYDKDLNEIIILYVKDNLYNEFLIIDNKELTVKKTIKLDKKIFDSKINSNIFKIGKKEYLAIFFNNEKQDYKIDSYISIFDKYGIKNTYNTIIQPYCAIVQKDDFSLIVIGGEKISNNNKFNYLLNILRKTFVVRNTTNDTKIQELSLASKNIYLIKLER